MKPFINRPKNRCQNLTKIPNYPFLLHSYPKMTLKPNPTQNHKKAINMVTEKEIGAFKAMNEGTAAITLLEESDQDLDKYFNCLYKLPLNVALVGYSSADQKTLDKVLQGLNAKEWQEAL